MKIVTVKDNALTRRQLQGALPVTRKICHKMIMMMMMMMIMMIMMIMMMMDVVK
jgi:hypothetical protein